MSAMIASYAGVGTAELSASLDSTEDGEAFRFHGVAIGAGDLTIGQSGTPKIWPGEVLEDAAESLEGKPLVRDHINTTEGRVGTVLQAEYREGIGVLYEAEIMPHYEDLAKDVQSGMMEVSARIFHPPEEELEETDEGALRVTKAKFDNLSVVNNGASPSNTAQPGENPLFDTNTAEASASIDGEFATATLERAVSVDPNVALDSFSPESSDVSDEAADDSGSTTTPETDVEEASSETTDVDEEDAELEADDSDQVDESEAVDDDTSVDSDSTDVEAEDAVDSDDTGEADDSDEADVSDESTESEEELEEPSESEDSVNSQADGQVADDAQHSDELAGPVMHEPTFDGVDDKSNWVAPTLESLLSSYDWDPDLLWDSLSEDAQQTITGHFLVSKTGTFPPENFVQLALPVVDLDRELNLSALENAKARSGQVEGVTGDMKDQIDSEIDQLVDEHFDGGFATEENAEQASESVVDDTAVEDEADSEEAESAADDETRSESADVAAEQLDPEMDDPAEPTAEPVRVSRASLRTTSTTSETMSDITYEELEADVDVDLDEPVLIEQAELEALQDDAERTDALETTIEDLSESIEEEREARVLVEQLSEADIEMLESDTETQVVDAELSSMVEDVTAIYADELANHSPFSAEELADRFTALELRDRVEEHETAELSTSIEESEPEPQAGDAEAEELSEEDDVDVEELTERYAQALENGNMHTQAEKVREGTIPLPDSVLEKLE